MANTISPIPGQIQVLLFREGIAIEQAGVLRDLSNVRDGMARALQVENERLEYEVSHDSLTGLYNRRAIEEEIFPLLTKKPDEEFFLIRMDLNDFKAINDSYGHQAGDERLTMYAQACKDSTRTSIDARTNDVAARLSGDEFLFFGIGDGEAGEAVARRIDERFQELQQSAHIAGEPITCSFGIANMRGNEEFDDVMRDADEACYEAKGNNKQSSGHVRRRR